MTNEELSQADAALRELFGEPISVYSRADAIADGILIDVTDTAREAGIRYPVALTAAAWSDCVAWTDTDAMRHPAGNAQDEAGRLWDVLWMARAAMRAAPRGVSVVLFELHRVARTGGRRATLAQLKAHCGPGDDGCPVITIMLPTED